jgi:epoxyqueuosine reductase
MEDATQSLISSLMERLGFAHWGIAPVERPHSLSHYAYWLEQEFYGEMTYLKTHLPQKAEPGKLLPQLSSQLVVAVDYFPEHPDPMPDWPIPSLPVAAYAQGRDYHNWLKTRLGVLADELKAQFPEHGFLVMSDSHPVLERDLAQRAGLGWFGKNTCLIHKQRGSLFLLGEIFTTLNLSVQTQPSADHCGTCRRCLDACPTQAFTRERELDARKCISYWTIEARGTPPPELRHAVGSWFFGCDICQQVCPWNAKVFGREVVNRLSPTVKEGLADELKVILTSSNKKLLKLFAGTPLTRPGGRGLKRNAILMAVHHKFKGLLDDILCVGADYPELGELAEWAKTELSSSFSDLEQGPRQISDR